VQQNCAAHTQQDFSTGALRERLGAVDPTPERRRRQVDTLLEAQVLIVEPIRAVLVLPVPGDSIGSQKGVPRGKDTCGILGRLPGEEGLTCPLCCRGSGCYELISLQGEGSSSALARRPRTAGLEGRIEKRATP